MTAQHEWDSVPAGQPYSDDPDNPLRGRSPWDVVMEGLARSARGEEPTDDEHDALEFAMTILCAAPLVHAGMSLDVVLDKFEKDDHTFHAVYEPGGDLTLEVRWGDGAVTTATESDGNPPVAAGQGGRSTPCG